MPSLDQWIWPAAIAVCLLVSILTPFVTVAARHGLRLRRLREIADFGDRYLGRQHQDAGAADGAAAGQAGKSERPITSFEYAGHKYTVDLETPKDKALAQKLRNLDFKDSEVHDHFENLGWWGLRSSRRLLWSAQPYMLACILGFALTLTTLVLASGACGARAAPACASYLDGIQPMLAAGSVGFLGAYVFTLQLLLRGVQSFDLSAITFFRAGVHVLLSVALVMLAYRLAPTVADLHTTASAVTRGWVASPEPATPLTSLAWQWYGIAFFLGFVPYAGIQFIFGKVSGWVPHFKTMDDTYVGRTKSVPLDYIDGIDFLTRFRMEEANIFEVQNLACANPILLFIETPYSLYQTIDWVAQAQLCTVLGPERFLVLRQYGIRTIFDLERAILSGQSTPGVRRAIGGIILMTTDSLGCLITTDKEVFADLAPDATTSRRTLQDFVKRFVELVAMPGPAPRAGSAPPAGAAPIEDAGLSLMVRMMLDDLHVHRLRQIWLRIDDQLGPESVRLRDTLREAGAD